MIIGYLYRIMANDFLIGPFCVRTLRPWWRSLSFRPLVARRSDDVGVCRTSVATNLEAVRAPTPIAFIHCDPTVMSPLGTAGMVIEQETVDLILHHPVTRL